MSLKQSQDLKQLQTRLVMLESEKQAAAQAAKEAQRKLSSITSKIMQVESDIAALKDSRREPIVSEHAILRYFERVYGFDLEVIKSEMVDQQTSRLIVEMRNGRFPIQGRQAKLVVKDMTVVTVETA